MLERVKKQLPEGEVVGFVTSFRQIPFTALKDNDAITFTSDGENSIPVKWSEFQQVLSLLLNHPKGVMAWDAQN
jgi:hypothetical protein